MYFSFDVESVAPPSDDYYKAQPSNPLDSSTHIIFKLLIITLTGKHFLTIILNKYNIPIIFDKVLI